jgi:phosphatidylglycerophosphatase A
VIDAPKNRHRAPLRPLDGPTLCLTTLGLGFMRPAPGSWGSLPPVGLAALAFALGADWMWREAAVLALMLVSGALCVRFGRYAEARFGRKDAAEVVADETAGQCLPLLLLPLAALAERHGLLPYAAIAGAFLLFRVCDIVKPWPARRLEALPHGWGVLMDDIIAGLYAAAAMHLALFLML